MGDQFDLKKEWEKTKVQLQKFSQEAAVLAKKGEAELVKFSEKGKLHLDSTAIGLRIERLYYVIGKEYVKNCRNPQSSGAQLDKLLKEVTKLEKEQKTLQAKMRKSAARKRSAGT